MDIKKTGIFTRPIASRGLHNQELPENSVAAFENAIKHGFAIELDVRLTDDNEAVVFCDDKLSRMTQKDGYVSKMLSTDLRKIHLYDQNKEPTDFTIPSLEDALNVINGKVPILIEVKNKGVEGPLEERIIEILHGYSGEYAVHSFNPLSLKYFKENAFNVLRGQQVSTKYNDLDKWLLKLLKRPSKLKKLVKISNPDFITYKALDLPNKHALSTGLPIIAYTIRSVTEFESISPHCDNIIFENYIPLTKENNTE